MTDKSPGTLNDSSSSESEFRGEPLVPCDPHNTGKPAQFDHITENVYLDESESTLTSKERKKAKRMVCDCQFDPELDDPEDACGENCLNRLLMIECGSRCPSGEYCTNKRFQRAEYAGVEVFKTELKGWGLRANKFIPSGSFVMEYCGEVITPMEFEERKKVYQKEKRRHYYFMSLKTDQILDATRKGNLSRFINHSCDPNCETQKWTVNGRLRIGFFTIKPLLIDEELTFDYQFQRFGEVAQKCYCGSANCRGYLGVSKQTTSGKMASQRDVGSPSVREGRRRGRQRIQSDADSMFEKEVYDIVGSSWRLRDSDQVVAISRIMLQAETPSQRIMLLQVLQATEDVSCLRKFLSLHGLRLLWSWMVDSADSDTPDVLQFRLQVLQTLDHLPITTKNQLEDNKIPPVVRKWAEKGAKFASKPPRGAEPTESPEGTIVTEADSAPCPNGGGVAGGMAREEEEGTCEAEARENSATESQDESQAVEEKLLSLATELLDKWGGLREVFRIPKRAPPLKKSSPDKVELEKREGRGEGRDGERRGRERERRREKRRHEKDSWSHKHRALLPTPKRLSSTAPPSPYTSTTGYTTSYTSSSNFTGNPSFAAGSAGFSAAAPVQNTVIVQQPGQSVYVQQQVFQDRFQTTILPTQYVQPTQQYMVHQSPLPALHPLPSPSTTPQQAGLIQYPIGQQQRLVQAQNFAATPATAVGYLQGVHGVHGGVQRTVQAMQTTHLAGQHQYFASPQPQPLFVQTQSQAGAVTTLTPLAPLPPPPPEEEKDLPLYWKTARDPQGKIYYYHIITRKSQWERPTDKDAEGTITMELATPEHEQSSDEESRGPHTPDSDSESVGQPRTPEGTPPPTPGEEESESEGSIFLPSSYTPPHTPPLSLHTPSPHPPSPRTPSPRPPSPHTPSPRPPSPRTPSPRPPSPRTPSPRPPSPHTPSPRPPSPHTPSPRPPSPHSPFPRPPSPHTPSSRPPSPHTPSPHLPSPHTSTPHSPTPPSLSSHPSSPHTPPFRNPSPQPPSFHTPSSAHSHTPSSSPHSPSQSPHPRSPQTSSPHPDSPQTSSPRPRSPQTSSPHLRSPQTSSPRPHSPQTSSPHPHSPQTSSPHIRSPQTSSPHPHSPQTSSPRLHSPQTSSPHLRSPQTSSPHPHSPQTSSPRPHSPSHTPRDGESSQDSSLTESQSPPQQLQSTPPLPSTPPQQLQSTSPPPSTPPQQLQSTPPLPSTPPQQLQSTPPPPSTPPQQLQSTPPPPSTPPQQLQSTPPPPSTPPQQLQSTSPPPSTPSPPSSPILPFHTPPSPGVLPPAKKRRKSRSKEEHATKEAFRHKVSKVVTYCLDQHRKPECKYGRITCSEDFKYLARKAFTTSTFMHCKRSKTGGHEGLGYKHAHCTWCISSELTYGLTEKEILRKGGIDKLVFNDSVKAKVKDYIRHYMKKFGSIYNTAT